MCGEGKDFARIATNLRGGVGADTTAFFDYAVWPEVAMIIQEKLEEIAQFVVNATREPEAIFCGFGFSKRELRKEFGFVASSNPATVKEAFDFNSGKMGAEFMKRITAATGTDPSQVMSGRNDKFNRPVGKG